ncbi:hypothetical protein [Streptomyces sp. NPDC055107]
MKRILPDATDNAGCGAPSSAPTTGCSPDARAPVLRSTRKAPGVCTARSRSKLAATKAWSFGLKVLIDVIRRKFTDVDSVPFFNDGLTSGRIPMRMLDQAASLVDARGL